MSTYPIYVLLVLYLYTYRPVSVNSLARCRLRVVVSSAIGEQSFMRDPTSFQTVLILIIITHSHTRECFQLDNNDTRDPEGLPLKHICGLRGLCRAQEGQHAEAWFH